MLITPIGRVIEKMSFSNVGLSMAVVIIGSATFFHFYGASYAGNCEGLQWHDAFYFSIITFSSLGYGEITPFGVGKLIASVEVISGLILTAIFVGKIASERQSALLLLLYTSEQQERISGFTIEVAELERRISIAIKDRDFKELEVCASEGYNFLSSICSYLIVHANQGDVAAFGNTSTLRKLYFAFFDYQRSALRALHLYNLSERTATTLGNTIAKLSGNARRMEVFHNNDQRARGILKTVMANGSSLSRFNEKISSGKLVIRSQTQITNELLAEVKKEMGVTPMGRDYHKQIAKKLAISNSLSSRCIKKILEDQQH